MGFASATDIATTLIPVVERRVTSFTDRKAIYAALISALEDADWDTQNEALEQSTAFDAAMQDAHPGWFEDDGRLRQ